MSIKQKEIYTNRYQHSISDTMKKTTRFFAVGDKVSCAWRDSLYEPYKQHDGILEKEFHNGDWRVLFSNNGFARIRLKHISKTKKTTRISSTKPKKISEAQVKSSAQKVAKYYKCDHCAYTHFSRVSLKQHMEKCDGIRCITNCGKRKMSTFQRTQNDFSIECNKCKSWYHDLCVGLFQLKDVPDKWLCPHCSSSPSSLDDLVVVLAAQRKRKRKKNVTFSSSSSSSSTSSTTREKKKIKATAIIPSSNFSCTKCTMNFRVESIFIQHMQSHTRTFQTCKCGYVSDIKSHFIGHKCK